MSDADLARLRRELNLQRGLTAAAFAIAITSLALGRVSVAAAPAIADRITAHRIDVVDRSGKLAMVLTSHDDFPEPVQNGKTVHRKSGNDENGVVFYNRYGDEQGALIWQGVRGPAARSGDALSFDSVDSDQLLQMGDGTDAGKHFAYLYGWDRASYAEQEELFRQRNAMTPQERQEKLPMRAIERQRFLLGYDGGGDSYLNLSDGVGRVRAQLVVEAGGRAALRFLDENGKETARFPQ